MRSATVNTTWRKLLKHSHSIKLNNIIIEELNRFSDQKIQFEGSITALCGINGLGKSTLLNSIYLLLNGMKSNSNDTNIYKKIKFSKLGGELTYKDDLLQILHEDMNFEIIDADVPISWLDTSFQVPNLIKQFSSIIDLNSLLDGVSPLVLDDEDKKNINYILNNSYTKCSVFEVDLDEETIPYFVVEKNGMSYGTEEMGHGEVAALYIYWKLKTAVEDTIFLIEEPETYLSYPSQKKVMDVIAQFSLKRKHSFILTTHSSAVLTNIPTKDIKIFIENHSDNFVKLINIEARRDYMYSLGLLPPKKGILLVEDRVARILLKHILSRNSKNINLEYEVIDCGSESAIQANLKMFPKDIPWLKIYGIFDGDQRSSKGEILKKTKTENFAFLPGNVPFEVQCQEIVMKYSSLIIDALRVNSDKFHESLNRLQGEDYHDWLIDLSKSLEVEIDTLIKTLYDIGIKYDSEFNTNVEESFDSINRLCSFE